MAVQSETFDLSTISNRHADEHDNDDYDDGSSLDSADDAAARKPLKPSNALEDDSDLDGDTTASERPPTSNRRIWSWWRQSMAGRARWTRGIAGTNKQGLNQALLHNSHDVKPRTGRSSYLSCCIFGGISGLTILALLLLVNLFLGIATVIFHKGFDEFLKGWGKPGTGTEGLAWYPTDFLRDVTPIPCHSHNDYWRKVPLFSALRAGCTSVEADVWLFNEDLLVGHNTASLTRNRTFTSLYIDPLVKILEDQNPNTDFYKGTSHGVFDTDPETSLALLVDVKTGGAETWPWVLKQLEPLRERGWLTYVENDKVYFGPITVVGTGNTPFDVLTRNATYRDTFFDAPLNQMWEARQKTPDMHDWPDADDTHSSERLDEAEGLAEDFSAKTRPRDAGQGMSGVLSTDEFNEANSYYASVSFNTAVGRTWWHRLSQKQMKIIRGQIWGAHRRGLKVRYWDLPSWPVGWRNHVWDVLVREGVDMLNVDDLTAASKQVW